nr:MAG TPA: Folliculin, tumor suppressor, protein binding.0A [Caudoviricetes sp.]
MRIITINNLSMTYEKAMENAEAWHVLTGEQVLVQNQLGDPVAHFISGKVIKF